MTLRTNARIAGVTFFIYLAAGISALLTGQARATDLPSLLTSFSALVLGVTLYAITRDQDPDLALLALLCRVLEAMPGDGLMYFAVGSTLFSWLLLRGRMIPAPLAWLGVISTGLMVIVLPLQRAGWLGGPTQWASSITWLMWLPVLVFEMTFAVWLLVKGLAPGSRGEPHRPALQCGSPPP
jgi:hypothetical protein